MRSSIGTFTASLRFIKGHQVNFKVAAVASVAALIGSPLGAKLAMAIDEKYLRYVLLIAVPIIAVMILRKKDFGQEIEHEPPILKSVLLSIAIGFSLGMYDGFFGTWYGNLFNFAA